jgi:hypothetical protein
MSGLSIRPTFELRIDFSKAEAIRRFCDVMKDKKPESLYVVHGEYSEFHLEDHLHRLWSPHLSVYFIDIDASDACKLIGRYAPRPNLWTLIWIFYLALFCCIFFAVLLGGSQWMLGHFPWGWVVAVPSAILYATLFLASQIGQSLCHDQMDLLRNRLDQALLEAGLIGQ